MSISGDNVRVTRSQTARLQQAQQQNDIDHEFFSQLLGSDTEMLDAEPTSADDSLFVPNSVDANVQNNLGQPYLGHNTMATIVQAQESDPALEAPTEMLNTNLFWRTYEESLNIIDQRIKLDVTDDDWKACEQRASEYVKSMIRAFGQKGLDKYPSRRQHHGDKRAVSTIVDPKVDTLFVRWQNVQLESIANRLKEKMYAGDLSYVERAVWTLFHKVIAIHDIGAPDISNARRRVRPDHEMRCSDRLEAIIEVMTDLAIVRWDILREDSIDELILAPYHVWAAKLTNFVGNHKLRQNPRKREAGEPGTNVIGRKRARTHINVDNEPRQEQSMDWSSQSAFGLPIAMPYGQQLPGASMPGQFGFFAQQPEGLSNMPTRFQSFDNAVDPFDFGGMQLDPALANQMVQQPAPIAPMIQSDLPLFPPALQGSSSLLTDPALDQNAGFIQEDDSMGVPMLTQGLDPLPGGQQSTMSDQQATSTTTDPGQVDLNMVDHTLFQPEPFTRDDFLAM